MNTPSRRLGLPSVQLQGHASQACLVIHCYKGRFKVLLEQDHLPLRPKHEDDTNNTKPSILTPSPLWFLGSLAHSFAPSLRSATALSRLQAEPHQLPCEDREEHQHQPRPAGPVRSRKRFARRSGPWWAASVVLSAWSYPWRTPFLEEKHGSLALEGVRVARCVLRPSFRSHNGKQTLEYARIMPLCAFDVRLSKKKRSTSSWIAIYVLY